MVVWAKKRQFDGVSIELGRSATAQILQAILDAGPLLRWLSVHLIFVMIFLGERCNYLIGTALADNK